MTKIKTVSTKYMLQWSLNNWQRDSTEKGQEIKWEINKEMEIKDERDKEKVPKDKSKEMKG